MRDDSLYIEVGKAIQIIQLADQAFKSMLLMVFPGKEFSDLETFNQNDKLLDKATLGKLVTILKRRVVLNGGFESVLNEYLADRNSLIHNWSEIEGWDEEAKAIEFTVSVQKKAAYLCYIFMGFLRAWMEQVGIEGIDEQFSEGASFFATIDSEWKDLINGLVEETKIT